MKIDQDLRGAPTFYFMILLFSVSMLGVLFAITSYRFGFPVEPNGALGLGSIIVATTLGPFFAFFIKRREAFRLYGNKRLGSDESRHGTLPKGYKKDE